MSARSGVSLAILIASLCLTGCGAQKGMTMVKYEKGHENAMTTAPHDGEYALFTMTDLTPQVVQPLKKGDSLGFEPADNGQTRAVAGTYSTILPKSTMKAYWKDYNRK